MISLACYPWNIALEKGWKVKIQNHILDAAGPLESLRLNQDFGTSSLKEAKEALKIQVILDEGILEGLLL